MIQPQPGQQPAVPTFLATGQALPMLPIETKEYLDADAVACSLENPETCEACQ
jgi:hypothetical protein